MGEFDLAREHLERAIAGKEKLFASAHTLEEHVSILQSVCAMANLLFQTRDYEGCNVSHSYTHHSTFPRYMLFLFVFTCILRPHTVFYYLTSKVLFYVLKEL